MMRRMLSVILYSLAMQPAHAEITIIQVPAACGTLDEVQFLLSVHMPVQNAIGIGGNSSGKDIAVLLTGKEGYWAMVATQSPNSYCIVASGSNWNSVDTETTMSY